MHKVHHRPYITILRPDEPTFETHIEPHSPLAHLQELQTPSMPATQRVMPSAKPIPPFVIGRPGSRA